MDRPARLVPSSLVAVGIGIVGAIELAVDTVGRLLTMTRTGDPGQGAFSLFLVSGYVVTVALWVALILLVRQRTLGGRVVATVVLSGVLVGVLWRLSGVLAFNGAGDPAWQSVAAAAVLLLELAVAGATLVALLLPDRHRPGTFGHTATATATTPGTLGDTEHDTHPNEVDSDRRNSEN